ncbi:hypothetical protein RND81_02G171100 [Saponaria officinalis]|uniref:Helicase C-terminal domain-containing protein n=1 Tax=Saponaria officinalis TaxID=3572 RepID=A0AAW1MQW7_SAPOF
MWWLLQAFSLSSPDSSSPSRQVRTKMGRGFNRDSGGCSYRHDKSRNTSLEEGTKNLVDFREKGGVLICTDAAARGLDIPTISHVIQK